MEEESDSDVWDGIAKDLRHQQELIILDPDQGRFHFGLRHRPSQHGQGLRIGLGRGRGDRRVTSFSAEVMPSLYAAMVAAA